MNLIVCLDDKNGMMFNKRRQSQDRKLRERILALTEGSKLWMSSYTAKQFTEGGNFIIDNDFMVNADSQDYCFVEDKEISFTNCDKIIVFKWNRHYPADKFFSIDLKANGYKKISQSDFEGYSHKKITEEIYVKK